MIAVESVKWWHVVIALVLLLVILCLLQAPLDYIFSGLLGLLGLIGISTIPKKNIEKSTEERAKWLIDTENDRHKRLIDELKEKQKERQETEKKIPPKSENLDVISDSDLRKKIIDNAKEE